MEQTNETPRPRTQPRARRRRKRRKSPLLPILLVLVLVAVGIFLLLAYGGHYIYIAGEYFGVHCSKVEVSEGSLDNLVEVSLADLQTDPRIQWDQSMMLVNEEHPLPEDFIPELALYKDTDVPMNRCLLEAYSDLAAAVTDHTGKKMYVSSTYRTQEEQEELYQEDPSISNTPGASEHQTGLGLDVYVGGNAGFGFIKTEAGQFVNSECWKYGFIIRYPSFGKGETGMQFEPWHLRYVGQPHAKVIYNNHETLEEYIASLRLGNWYQADGYWISRQSPRDGSSLQIPADFNAAVVSPDNQGNYVITIEVR